MTTRTELLDTFKARLDGEIIRCDAYRDPVTGKMIDRNQNKQANMPDKRSAIIEIEESPDGSWRLERHITFFFDSDDFVKKNVQFYCINRGREDERCGWLKSQEPKPEPRPKSFQQIVLEWLRNKVGQTVDSWTVKHVVSTTADQEAQTATARALCEDETGNAWLDVFLTRNAQGNVQMEVLEITRLGA
jgi:hypothetical protein